MFAVYFSYMSASASIFSILKRSARCVILSSPFAVQFLFHSVNGPVRPLPSALCKASVKELASACANGLNSPGKGLDWYWLIWCTASYAAMNIFLETVVLKTDWIIG